MTPARVLVVEDDRVVARDIQQQLRRIGHDVVGSTARGEDAVGLALQSRPDLVLMDIRLEGKLDGIEAAAQIRDSCRTPVVFLTAYADDETVQRASLTEPFGYLLKPFEESQLRTVIEMALYKHSAENRLRESERRYATTLSSIGDAVIATDAETRVTLMNPVAERLTGWLQDEARGRPVSDVFRVFNEVSREPIEDPASAALRHRTTIASDGALLMSREGHQVRIDDCGAPIIDDAGNIAGTVVVFRDITRRHEADEQLRDLQLELARAERLMVMGALTVSIAHEVNQPLMAIVTNAATCRRWLTVEPPQISEARTAAEHIVREGHRAGEIVSSVRALAQKSQSKMQAIDLNSAILEILVLMRSEMRRHDILCETELSPCLGPVLGNRIQLQQVMMNLMMNGIEAIVARPDAVRVLRITSRPDEAGFVAVSVSDTGEGIDAGNAERIFDSFFTTKPAGTGIGLSICRSIVEAHGGQLSVVPNMPHGSTFSFTLAECTDAEARRVYNRQMLALAVADGQTRGI
jgi:PAS domain S-box-containing protein